jgi:hypothetical protein
MEKAHLEILLEDIRGKLDLVLESHEALHTKIDDVRHESIEKHDLTAFQLKVLNDKIDAVAVDLSAHRADTEAHVKYRVRE